MKTHAERSEGGGGGGGGGGRKREMIDDDCEYVVIVSEPLYCCIFETGILRAAHQNTTQHSQLTAVK